MMDSYREAENELSDSRDDACSPSGCSNFRLDDCGLGYEFWTKEPDSIKERRSRFLRWMGFSADWGRTSEDEEEDSYQEYRGRDIDRLQDDGGAVLANFYADDPHFSSTRSFRSYDSTYLLEDGTMEGNKIESFMDEQSSDGSVTTSLDLGSDKTISYDEFQKTLGSSSLVEQLLTEESKGLRMVYLNKKGNWLRRFNAITHIVDRAKVLLGKTEIDPKHGSATQRVRVNVCSKNSKELSSLCKGQEFAAHKGSILTMKFSPDGMHLASAGLDGVVRVWKVLEDDFLDKINTQDTDPSCLYFSLNQFSKLAPLDVAKEQNDHRKSLNKSLNSNCVLLPPKIFQLSEKPLHEFHGHEGEVLALSWSKNGHLLSSSVDKTARLWRVGYEHCLQVYSHNNYVTCVDFNPVDDNHFISGSIDGKLRMWEVPGGRVVDWTDIKEIVTAVVYRPDGKGGVIGSMNGTCHFYDIIENRLQLGDSIRLKGKRKLTQKKIIGFQYCPSDASKVMVTSGDAQVQILCETNIICKFKGNRNSGSQMGAAFTSDGEHIVSATEDSSVRVWNYTSQEQQKNSCRKKMKSIWCSESFTSRNASIAIPWNKLGAIPASILGNRHFDETWLQKFHASFPDCFTMSLSCFLDALNNRGSPTWPEEKLPQLEVGPGPVKASVGGKSEFRFLKNAWVNAFHSPHLWGSVIVTAGWDGCIRTFLNYGLPIKF